MSIHNGCFTTYSHFTSVVFKPNNTLPEYNTFVNYQMMIVSIEM